MESDKVKTRNLTESERSRVVFDLTFRGLVSLASALCVIVFAVMLSIYGNKLFMARGLVPICHGGIWIAVIAVDFGLIRTGIQLLVWRKGLHKGVVFAKGINSGGLFETLFNIISAIVFIGLGIAVLLAGQSGLDGLRTATQIPLAILSITFGLSSAESALSYFWRRHAGLADLVHELPERDNKDIAI